MFTEFGRKNYVVVVVVLLLLPSLCFIHMICNFICMYIDCILFLGNIFLVIRLFSHTWCAHIASHRAHTHRILMWRCKHSLFRWWSFCFVNAAQLIYRLCVSIHGLLHISGLYQFIDVIECGEHSRLLGISKTGTFFINIMAALSILSASRSTHVFKESQYLHVIGRWLPQLVQFSVEKDHKIIKNVLWKRRNHVHKFIRKWKILRILFISAFIHNKKTYWNKWHVIILSKKMKTMTKENMYQGQNTVSCIDSD